MRLLIIILFSIFGTMLNAQGWEQDYTLNLGNLNRHALQQMPNGDFVMFSKPSWEEFLIVKTDSNGIKISEINLDTSLHFHTNDAIMTSDGGYLLSGLFFSTEEAAVLKLDANGQLSWTYRAAPNRIFYNGIEASNGGYVLLGTNANYYTVTKIDINGNLVWQNTNIKERSTRDLDVADFKETPAGNYLIGGRHITSNGSNVNVFLYKLNANGQKIWSKDYINTQSSFNNLFGIVFRPNGDYLIAKYTYTGRFDQVVLLDIDTSGYLRKETPINSTVFTSNEHSSTIISVPSGGYIITQNSCGAAYVIKLEENLKQQWDKYFNIICSSILGHGNILATIDGGFALTGTREQLVRCGGDILSLVKTDAYGNIYTGTIVGNVFRDSDGNCAKDSTEKGKANILLEVIGRLHSHYTSTDSLGNYSIGVNEESQYVKARLPSYWGTCVANPYMISVSQNNSRDTVNFPLQALVNCPMLEVDISAPFLRITGGGSFYTVSYCNVGTVASTNTLISVNLDPSLNYISSSFVGVQENGIYTFNVGTVEEGACSSFSIRVQVDTAAVVGQVFCTEVSYSPDSLCEVAWNGALLSITPSCQGDNVEFVINNIGRSTFNRGTYIVYENQTIVYQGRTERIAAGSSSAVSVLVKEGKTYRIEIAQPTGLPSVLGNEIVSATVEACKKTADGKVNTGFVNQFSNDYDSPFRATDCQEAISSLDPNDKTPQPMGYDETAHYINQNTAISYRIRFQNTGTDTAFKVVVLDTISPFMDLGTLQMGASSHAYTWRIYEERILEVVFKNILLVDSTTNEEASHGFFKYKISQKRDNDLGSKITNIADIYFDFNPPVRTNRTWHTIGKNFVKTKIIPYTSNNGVAQIAVYPNPFGQQTTITVIGASYEKLNLVVFDLAGRVMDNISVSNTYQIAYDRGNLSAGMYLYSLKGDGKIIGSGKIVITD